MLVLSRQRDETIMIGDEIEITGVDIRGDKVRLGISAPTKIAVHRKEVYDAIKKENEQAATLTGVPFGSIPNKLSPGPQRNRTIEASRLKPNPSGPERFPGDAGHSEDTGADRRTA